MKKILSFILVLIFFSPVIDAAAASKYISGKKGGCYTVMKSKKTGKTYKKYVDTKFCRKK